MLKCSATNKTRQCRVIAEQICHIQRWGAGAAPVYIKKRSELGHKSSPFFEWLPTISRSLSEKCSEVVFALRELLRECHRILRVTPGMALSL